jgi:hypothetical protein
MATFPDEFLRTVSLISDPSVEPSINNNLMSLKQFIGAFAGSEHCRNANVFMLLVHENRFLNALFSRLASG